MMAAGRAAQRGAEVILLEKMERLGRKVNISGKGRCNLTNTAPMREFIRHFGTGGRFLRSAFHAFFNDDLVRFLEERGLELVTKRGGRIFPASGRAMDVTRILEKWLRKEGVDLRLNTKVDDIAKDGNAVVGVKTGGEILAADAVVLSTGGLSYPATGSTGDGYPMVHAAGHHVVDTRPALVPLEAKGDDCRRMAGLGLRNVSVTLWVNGSKAATVFGEMTFEEFGVSGPVILRLSSHAVDRLREGASVQLSIDLKPALDEQKLDRRLIRDFEKRATEPFSSVIRGLVAKEMVPVCLESTGIPGEQTPATITAEQRKRLRMWLKDFRLDITGYRPFTEAIITAGGVDLGEVDPTTMQSKLVQGLYIAGEILDIQGNTGGYNLQAAFSTGRLAGESAAASGDGPGK